jgi:hypothetical protein
MRKSWQFACSRWAISAFTRVTSAEWTPYNGRGKNNALRAVCGWFGSILTGEHLKKEREHDRN